MKGVPDAPRCGFSNAVVQILRMHGIQYDSHDVLANEELRQGDDEYYGTNSSSIITRIMVKSQINERYSGLFSMMERNMFDPV